MEYFAEASEAFFGTNDFYPFVRAELRGTTRGWRRCLTRCGNRGDTPGLEM